MELKESLLLWSSPFAESEAFMLDMIKSSGSKTFICLTDKDSKTFLAESEIKGYKINRATKFLNYDGDLKKLFSKIKKSVAKGSLLCVDNISRIIDDHGISAISGLKNLNDELTVIGAKALFLFTEWPYEDDVFSGLKSSFKEVATINEFNGINYFSLDGTTTPYSVTSGGLKVSNKIIVIGPEKSGKTSFIKSVSNNKSVFDNFSNDLTIDYADCDEFQFIGASGSNYSPLLSLFSDASSVLIMVDPSKHESIMDAKSMISSSVSNGFRVIIGNNDFRGTGLKASDLRQLLGVSDDIKVIDLFSEPGVLKRLLNY
ncbi:MAG TPA: hypothetical protein VI790_04245 [Candidatus Nanoarchaeia archaeon]|nr:hypothetical protein [Candidatus Nanoarchaeia archaeon]